MIEKDLPLEEFIAAPGVITSLSQLTREQFLELISSSHPDAVNYRMYAKKEYENRNKGNQALNDFYRNRFLNKDLG
jgi:hypothetical protein